MRKKILIFLSVCMLFTVIPGCEYSVQSSVKQESISSNLDFEFDVNPNNFEITVSVDNKIEKVSDPLQYMEVKNLKESKDEVSWSYPDENIDVNIKKQDNYLDVSIISNIEEESTFTWPLISGENYVIPFNEGKFIPKDDIYWKEFLDERVYHNLLESFSMQFFSVEKEEYALTYIVKNKFNNMIEFDTKDNIKFSFTHEYPSINENKEYGFKIYVTDNNVVDMAKTYKNYIVENNEFTTLKEKANDNKNIEKLYGAPHIYFWDMSIIGESDIKWAKLKEGMPIVLENWIKELLKNEVEDGSEIIDALDSIKTSEYIDKYQKTQIVKGFNALLKLPEFYNADVFKNTNDKINVLLKKGVGNLNKIELVTFNKELLNSELSHMTIDIDQWGKVNTIDVLDDMKNSGIDNAWIGFDDIEGGYVSNDFVNKAKDYGYLIAPYDSYHSIHKPGEESWSTATFEDETLYENATVEDKNGEKLLGFNNVGRKLNPTLSHESVKNRVTDIVETGYGFNSWFMDVDATGEIYDDYSKDHITTQQEDLEARLKRMEYIRDEHNMVIGSEGGNDFSSETIAFAHGIETPVFTWMDKDMKSNKESEYYVGRYYSPTGGVPEIFSKQVPVKELYTKIFFDQKYSLPLFRLVYNDSVITSHQWLWATFKAKDEVMDRQMQEILYNTAPMYHIDKVEWEKHKDTIVKHNEIWSDFNKKAINQEMIDFQILSEDRLVQMSKFGENLLVVANFSNENFDYNGDIIKGNSLIIYDNGEKIIYE